MANYVYITEQCSKDIKRQQYTKEIETFRKKAESLGSDAFERYPPPFIKKRFERQVRLVAREYLAGDHIVIAFLRLLVRGGSEYARFMDSDYQELAGFDKMAAELGQGALRAFVESRKEPPPPLPPKPSAEEEVYLHSALGLSADIYQDNHCCETQLWVEAMRSPQFADRRNLFVEPVWETIDNGAGPCSELRCKADGRFGILFRRIPDRKMVILFTPFKGEPPTGAVNARYPELLAENPPAQQIVLPKAKRAYPHELVLNEDAWLQVQKDDEGNMALSMEEIDVLESARKFEGGYPLFINGSAGSGKSTILQYLFSEYLFHHLDGGKNTTGPVMFACNDQLLARTNASVRSLLKICYTRKPRSNGHADSWLKECSRAIDESLHNFHKWLAVGLREKFQPGHLVDYGRFKQWWAERFSHEKSASKLYNADISWHVIRTYIKGYDPEQYLDRDDYLEIASKRKSVTPETYQVVFDKVWRRYQEDQRELGLWDHQDLARHVLGEGLIQARFPTVFCDEAQDFTRIELEALHRHCLFYSRSLHSHQLAQIPVAFAGDPFQTLNPTGFRWEATKAFFTDKFIKGFPGEKQREINYRNLTYNYRSTQHIVRFNNSLQLLRSVVFGFSEIKPQQPWLDEEGVPHVTYFDRGDHAVLRKLKEQSEIRIVVPCDEGFEGEWAKENGLAEYVEFDDAGVPKNVVSATAVKGLEFPRVVLFGFGGACPAALRACIVDNGGLLEGDSAIEPQYFLNRLYVGASRPRKRLFIVDSERDIQDFWTPIFEKSDDYVLRSRSPSDWETPEHERLTGEIIKGSLESWVGDHEDPLETANKLAEEGRTLRHRLLLRQASQSYRAAGQPKEASRCIAEALQLEGSFVEAARLWKDLGHYELSLAAAWNARKDGYDFILKLGEDRPELKNRVHWKFANFFQHNPEFNEGVVLIKDLVDALLSQTFETEVLTSAVWPDAIKDCLERIQKMSDKELGLWALTYRNASKLAEYIIKLPDELLGDLAFRGGLLAEACRHWETVPADRRVKFERNFLEARVATQPFPQNLDTLGELLSRHRESKFAQDIVGLVEKEGQDRLSDSQMAILARANLVLNDTASAVAHVNRITDRDVLADLLEAVCKGENDGQRSSVLARSAKVLADADEWQGVLDLMRLGTTRTHGRSESKRAASRDPRGSAIPVVEVLALEYGLEKARNELKTQVAEWLRENFPLNLSWRKEIHPLLVGRVFERAGLFRETLPYYEALGDSKALSTELRRQAWLRWTRVKLQQAEHDTGRRQVAEKALREARDRAERLGLSSPSLVPEELTFPLPQVEAEAVTSAPAGSPAAAGAKLTEKEKAVPAAGPKDFARSQPMGDLNIRVSPDGNRINIEHRVSLVQGAVLIRQRQVSLDGEVVPLDESGSARLESLGLVIELGAAQAGKINFKLVDGLELSVPVATGDLD